MGIEPEDLLDQEPLLLNHARHMMGRLPFDQIDFLVVGELGKNYSGTGLDPNVIGRQRVETMPDLPRPVVTRLAVLDLAEESHGNALGIGLADLTTETFVRKIDPEPMRINSLTSNFLTRAKVPLAMPTDRDVIETGLNTCWRTDWSESRMVIIPNTLELETLFISEALLAEARALPGLSVSDSPFPWPIDEKGALRQSELFPKANQGRRKPH
jgi:hypothetical protein